MNALWLAISGFLVFFSSLGFRFSFALFQPHIAAFLQRSNSQVRVFRGVNSHVASLKFLAFFFLLQKFTTSLFSLFYSTGRIEVVPFVLLRAPSGVMLLIDLLRFINVDTKDRFLICLLDTPDKDRLAR